MAAKHRGGDRRSERIEAHHDYLMGLIRRTPDITMLEVQERLIDSPLSLRSFSRMANPPTASLEAVNHAARRRSVCKKTDLRTSQSGKHEYYQST
jgi:hypothetical protein